MEIRSFRPDDASEVERLIARTLRVTNSRDYSPEDIEANVLLHSAQVIRQQAEEGHSYLACDGGKIVGCATVAGIDGSLTESILRSIFVLPEYQGRGIGRRLVDTLERDEYFLRARRVEISSSITAVEFYRKLGYTDKGGSVQFNGNAYMLEKVR